MHIVVADDLPSSALALFHQEGWHVDARTGRTAEQLAADLADADALVVRSATKVTAAIIAAAPRLRAIARAGTGVDNVNVEAATARGIVVMNAPGANTISVTELAMAQLLSLARRLPAADASMKQGKWDKKSFLGEEIRGKVLGLVGFGRVGREVARRAQAFAHDGDRPRSVRVGRFQPPSSASSSSRSTICARGLTIFLCTCRQRPRPAICSTLPASRAASEA